MGQRPAPEGTEPWYKRLSVFEWACLGLFVVPGLGYLLAQLPQLAQLPVDFWLTRVLYASSGVLLPIVYGVITWSTHQAMRIALTRGPRRIDKMRLIFHTVRPFWKFPALLLVVLPMTVQVIPEDFPSDVVLNVVLIEFVGLFLIIGCVTGVATHLLRTRG